MTEETSPSTPGSFSDVFEKPFYDLTQRSMMMHGDGKDDLLSDVRIAVLKCFNHPPPSWWLRSFYAKCIHCMDTLGPIHEDFRDRGVGHLLGIMLPALRSPLDSPCVRAADVEIEGLLAQYEGFENTEGRYPLRADAFWAHVLGPGPGTS